jgi:hypothetical protein
MPRLLPRRLLLLLRLLLLRTQALRALPPPHRTQALRLPPRLRVRASKLDCHTAKKKPADGRFFLA